MIKQQSLKYYNLSLFSNIFQSLSPGVTLTDASEKSLRSHPETTFLKTKDVVDAIIYILGTPPTVQVY